MKSKKSILSLLLVLTLVVTISLSGCSKQADAPAGDGLKIAIVTSPSGVDDGSFNEDNYNGVLNSLKQILVQQYRL